MSSPNKIFEAKYIAIKWADKDSALNIKESKDSIPIEIDDQNHYTLEATTFSKVNAEQFGQIGFRIIDEKAIQQVYLLKANGRKSNLRPVLDSETKKTWWVESEVWSKSNKRWQSEIFRTSGKVSLYISNFKCTLKIGTCSFSYEQLSSYLQDFKNDLWYLALHETSYISAPVKEKAFEILNEASIEYFSRFIEFAEKIVKKPKSELREIQELKNLKQVKPIPRTFMEIATRGFKKQLTSRGSRASYNVPENRYVLFVVNRIYNLLNNLGKVSNYISTSLQEKIVTQNEMINSFTDTIDINREAVVSDYKELQSKIEKERELISKFLNNQPNDNNQINCFNVNYELTLGKQYGNDNSKFFHKSGLEKPKENHYYRLEFCNVFQGVFKENKKYKINGKVEYKIEPYKSKTVHILIFHYFNTLERLDLKKKLDDLRESAQDLAKTNWKRPITNSEKNDQEQEKIAIKSLMDSASLEFRNIKKLSIKLIPTLNKLRNLRKKLIKLKIKPKSKFPNSMSFIQNPNYQGVHKLYKEIQLLSGIDERVFKGLEDAEEIGILNTSLLYERWCLLQIIKVLIDKFNFKPEKEWKNKLLNQIINLEPNQVRDVELKFENKKTNRNITLYYEKELSLNDGSNTPRRADFVIDLTNNDNVDRINSKRLVLDAKFYENINDKNMGGISKVIDELYNTKNYSESSKNQVFILHPSLKSVPEIKTPQEWSENSYFGETFMFDWDSESPNHRYGALLLSPIQNKGKYIDNLQMCIGMFLQYGIEENRLVYRDEDEDKNISEYSKWLKSYFDITNTGFNPVPCEKHFCIVCGHDKYTCVPAKTYYGLKWTYTCSSCVHKTYYNYCINKDCRNRLIKHGPYWTYHATQSMQPYNIKCPSCGEITVDMDNK